MFNPTTMIQAIGLAKLVEEKFNAQRKQGKQPFNKPQGSQASPKCTHLFQIKQLSKEEMNEHKAKGICYNYDEKYAPGHQCTTQKLYLLNVDVSNYSEDEIVIEEEANEPEINK